LGKTQGRLRAAAYRTLVRARDTALRLRRSGPR
jgi:hypothetical protein